MGVPAGNELFRLGGFADISLEGLDAQAVLNHLSESTPSAASRIGGVLIESDQQPVEDLRASQLPCGRGVVALPADVDGWGDTPRPPARSADRIAADSADGGLGPRSGGLSAAPEDAVEL